jgi:hypothetical protein
VLDFPAPGSILANVSNTHCVCNQLTSLTRRAAPLCRICWRAGGSLRFLYVEMYDSAHSSLEIDCEDWAGKKILKRGSRSYRALQLDEVASAVWLGQNGLKSA